MPTESFELHINASHPCRKVIYFIYNIWPEFYELYTPDKNSQILLYIEDKMSKMFLFESLGITTLISWINFIFIFYSGLEMFSIHNSHHNVYGCFFMFFLIWPSPRLLTIYCPALYSLSSTASWQTPSSAEKSKLILKDKYLKKTLQLF